jgi:hypothetical protein
VDKLRLKWKVATVAIRAMLWTFTGTSAGYNQWAGGNSRRAGLSSSTDLH